MKRQYGPFRAPFRCFVAPLLALALTLGPVPQASAQGQRPILLVTDPETTDLLLALGAPLARAAGLPPESIRFHVILDASLNAFALQNRRIVFNSGVILAAHGRDELAGVVAHEIAHLSAGHHIQLQAEAENLSLSSLIAMAAGIAAGVATGDARISQAAIAGGGAAAQSALLSTMRRKESQADRLAIHYLNEAGFDPHGMDRFLGRIVREQRLATHPPPYLLSHPVSAQRLTEARDLADQQTPTEARPDTESAWLARIQAKLEAGLGNDPGANAARFAERLAQLAADPGHDPATETALRYGLATAERYAGRLEAAETGMTALLEQAPDNPYFLRERGLSRLERGRYAEAQEDFRAALALLPNHFDLRYRLAFALSQQEQYEEASRILRRLTSEHPLESKPFYLLGLTERKMGHLGSSHLALARHYRLIGERDTATWHYREAARLFPPEAPERTIAKAELALLSQSD